MNNYKNNYNNQKKNIIKFWNKKNKTHQIIKYKNMKKI